MLGWELEAHRVRVEVRNNHQEPTVNTRPGLGMKLQMQDRNIHGAEGAVSIAWQIAPGLKRLPIRSAGSPGAENV